MKLPSTNHPKAAMPYPTHRDALHAHIATSEGRYINLLAPQPDGIHLMDIAQGLARESRFAGQTIRTLSVAEHSLLATEIAERDLGVRDPCVLLLVLLHDAPEAYLGDDTSPKLQAIETLQPGAAAALELLHAQLTHAIHRKYRLTTAAASDGGVVRRADLMALATERRDLMPEQQARWASLDGIQPAAWINLREQDQMTAEDWQRAFVDRVQDLLYARKLRGEQLSGAY